MWSQWKRWIAYPLFWCLLMLAPMLFGNWLNESGARSKVNDFQITRFEAVYRPSVQGTKLAIAVTETITADFPTPYTNHGIERRLDADYGRTSIELSDYTVTDPRGKALPFSVREADDGDPILRIGSPTSYVYGPTTYVISYTIGNGMVGYPDGAQEIYLDVNGTGWLQPFTQVSATLDLPADLAGRLTGANACYRGPAGSTDPCTITRTSTGFTAAAGPLGPRETMTIAAGFQPGTVQQVVPPPRTVGLGWWGVVAMPVLGLLLLGLALLVRRLRNRPLTRDDAPVQFTAPEDVSPLLAADFLAVPERGATAQLAALVLAEDARIESPDEAVGTAPQPRSGLTGRELSRLGTLEVALTDPARISPKRLRKVCVALFGDGDPRRLGSATRSEIDTATYERRQLLEDSGLRQESRAAGWILGIGYIGLVLLGWFQLLVGLPGLAWPFLGFGLMAVLLVVAAAHFYPRVGRLSERGRALMNRLMGLRRFVLMAEAERIAWMQNAVDAPRRGTDKGSYVDLYEPLLPYAVIFGAERTWLDLLGEQYQTFEANEAAPRLDLATLGSLWSSEDASTSPIRNLYDRSDRSSWWESRPTFGDGSLAHGWSGFWEGVGEMADEWATSSSDDDGGGRSSGWSSSRSRSSSSSSSRSGSSGRGSSGGGIGGGGGGGW